MSNSNITREENSIPWGPFFILVIGAFMSILDGSIVNVALPRLMTLFGASTEDIQWVLTGYLLASGSVIPITGYLSDVFGNKRLYIWSIGAFTIGSALCALSWNTNTLTAARVVQAIGGGMIIPVSMTMIYRIVPPKKIGMALGIWGVSAIMAPAIGPTLGGYLVDNFSWQWIFTINLPIGVVAVLLSIKYLKETPLRKDLKPDITGIILSSGGCLALLLALSEGQDKGWTSQYIVTLLIVSFFSLLIFVLWELTIKNPLIDIRLLANPVFSASLMATCISTMGLYAAIFVIPLYAQNLLGYTPMETGLMMMPSALVTGFLMPVAGKLFDRHGAAILGFIGMTILTLVTYYLHHLSLDSSYSYIQGMLALRAVGLGLCSMPLTTAGMNTIPRHLVGRASALNNTIRQIAGSISIAVLTYVMVIRQAYHGSLLRDSVSYTSPMAGIYKAQIAGYLASNGITSSEQTSLSIISGLITKQSLMNAMDDTFVVATLVMLLVYPFLFLLSKGRVEKERIRQAEHYAHIMPQHIQGQPSSKVE